MNEAILRATIPVILNTYEQVSFLKRMVVQLHLAEFRNIIIIDQNSQFPPLLEFLQGGAKERLFTLFTLDENVGPRWFFTSALYDSMPERFIYSDPDLAWPDGIADDLVGRFIRVSEDYKVGKVGSALTLPDEALDVTMTVGGQQWTVRAWEERFWANELEPGVYNAPVDTTFHLVNKKYFTPRNFISGVRIGGAGYECKHLPWYAEERASAPEFSHYKAVSKWSVNI
jgi:hypothetical protein